MESRALDDCYAEGRIMQGFDTFQMSAVLKPTLGR